VTAVRVDDLAEGNRGLLGQAIGFGLLDGSG
jgi:hypothetical protein